MRFSALFLTLMALAVGCHPKEAAPAVVVPVAVPVSVGAVTEQPLRRTIPVTGTLNGSEDVILSPKADGRIVSAAYDLGDTAIPGSVLLDIDPTDYRKAVTMERRALEVELAKLDLKALPAGLSAEKVPDVQKAEAAREGAADKNDRMQKLSGNDQEKATAASELKVAEANKRLAITQAQATLASARMRAESLAMAEQKLADCQLKVPEPPAWGAWAAAVGPVAAPFRYTVAAKMVSDGQMTRSFPGTDAYRLVISHALKLKVTVPEKHTPEVRVGQPVEVKVDAFPNETFPGTVARISPVIDPATRTFQVEVAVPNAHGKLKPGGFARAQLVVATTPATVVPPTALVVFAGVSKVFVADGDKARAVPVEVGDRGPDWLEVKGDLKPGEKVLTSGFTQLFDGAPISVR